MLIQRQMPLLKRCSFAAAKNGAGECSDSHIAPMPATFFRITCRSNPWLYTLLKPDRAEAALAELKVRPCSRFCRVSRSRIAPLIPTVMPCPYIGLKQVAASPTTHRPCGRSTYKRVVCIRRLHAEQRHDSSHQKLGAPTASLQRRLDERKYGHRFDSCSPVQSLCVLRF